MKFIIYLQTHFINIKCLLNQGFSSVSCSRLQSKCKNAARHISQRYLHRMGEKIVGGASTIISLSCSFGSVFINQRWIRWKSIMCSFNGWLLLHFGIINDGLSPPTQAPTKNEKSTDPFTGSDYEPDRKLSPPFTSRNRNAVRARCQKCNSKKHRRNRGT